MAKLFNVALQLRQLQQLLRLKASQVKKDQGGQDLIEYALLAAAIAVVVAGFLPQTLMPSISTIFSQVVSSFNATPP